MMTYKIQIDDLVRDATAQEVDDIIARERQTADAETEAKTRLAALASAQSKLADLGLTEAEIKALVG